VATEEEATRRSRAEQARSRLLAQLRNRELENRVVEVQISERSTPMVEVFSTMGAEQMGMNLQEMLGEMMPRRQRTRRVPVREARRILAEEESQKLIDKDKMVEEALHRVENSGIIFIDEMDKLIGGGNDQVDVSRQGVQRDMLPIVEGTTVMTRHGTVQTDHILFIAAGAFHGASPSDLIPELQGRFPIRVELARLTEGDFLRILTEPRNALVRQYEALIKTEGLKLVFEPEALKEISHLAYLVNERTEDIGARRLHTVMEKLLEDVSFRAPQLRRKSFTVDAAYVRSQLGEIVEHEDLSRYIL